MNIAISGLNNTDNPAPGIPVIKSLKQNHTIIGLSYNPNETGNYMHLCHKVYLMPYPSLGFEELKARLEYILKTTKIDLLIPNLDAELPLYIKYKKEIEKMGIKLCIPSSKNFELRNKNKLTSLSKQLGISYPKTYEISSEQELKKLIKDNKLDFPIMVKGNYYKAYMCQNIETSVEKFYKISNEWGFPILMQEVVKGEELNFVGVGDGKGNLVGGVAIKKLTTTEIGKIWTAITIENEKLINIAKEFIAHTKWEGPFELECIVDRDKIFMIEINPRFPAWVYFATELGINLPKMVVDIVKNKDITPQLTYPKNKMYVRFTGELVTDFTEFTKLISTKEI